MTQHNRPEPTLLDTPSRTIRVLTVFALTTIAALVILRIALMWHEETHTQAGDEPRLTYQEELTTGTSI